ncbi:mechanosensitive ion channel [Aquabacterium soli]|uniref:Mechanosensitive ion channel n=1 Tax=Aquabacterium soli TaxID=2493092 RepID=A0A3R8T372_9BURK|nr:mechanosensitive ion channel domain-containing protein [Aquabacterium soli]RRS02923.1 mechanosensitive ion channel [Aquabacterium soli]
MHDEHLHTRSTLRWLAMAALAPLLSLVLTCIAAQPNTTAATIAASAAVAPIAVADILARADEDQQRVDLAKHLLAAPDPVDRLGTALDDIARPVDAKQRTAAAGTLRQLPVMRLESLARHWAFDTRRFERWEAQARRELAPYADSALQLAQRRAAWSATRAEGLLEGLPPAMSTRVDDMIGQIDASEAALGTALARQFALKQRASELQARIQAGKDEVAAAIDDIDHRLLQTDAPPLWQGLGQRPDSQAAWAAMEQGIQIERQFALDYRAFGTNNRQVLGVLQILLLPLILWLMVRSRRAQDGAAPPVPATALHRPISAWVLLSMLAVLALEPDAPLLVEELALLIALVPVLRLLPAGVLQALGVWPYVAVGLYALDRLGVAAVADAGLYRLFLLALNGLALGLTAWLLNGAGLPAASRGSPAWRIVRPIGWVVLTLLAVAAVSNIAGNVSLAEMLTSGVIDSGYMALLLSSSVVACLGIFGTLLGQPELANRRLVRQQSPLLLTACRRLLVLGASLGWLLYTLDRFRVLRPLHDAGATVLALGIDVGEVSIHLGDVLVFGLSVWIAFWAARTVRHVLRDELPRQSRLPRGVGNSIASLSYYGVLMLGLLVALSAAGFQVSQLALVFGALGVGIGFGLQGVVNNFVSGLVLMFERPIQPGDVVDAAGTSGTVREIHLRSTIIRTSDGADVVVPNGLLISGNLTNWTMFDRSRCVEIQLGVAPDSDPASTLAVLGAAARSTPGAAEKPEPVVLMTGYVNGTLTFVVRAWTDDLSTAGALRGELLARTLAALRAARIAIPNNQLDLHLRAVPEPVEAWLKHESSGTEKTP